MTLLPESILHLPEYIEDLIPDEQKPGSPSHSVVIAAHMTAEYFRYASVDKLLEAGRIDDLEFSPEGARLVSHPRGNGRLLEYWYAMGSEARSVAMNTHELVHSIQKYSHHLRSLNQQLEAFPGVLEYIAFVHDLVGGQPLWYLRNGEMQERARADGIMLTPALVEALDDLVPQLILHKLLCEGDAHLTTTKIFQQVKMMPGEIRGLYAALSMADTLRAAAVGGV
ncbi:hypothetical protein J4460_08640 [Candidatus Woesearchaeota archaeon]|nr:MAG: hypothetical protein QS99_C0013G0029 [archaeon GW2011_AR4]MBS3130705.1 hypothetical protein [Candidatus Woesearchaeota archaeon]HIH38832.1 hypothetical protein [Candidatus Woesearchaeota archaeon]HIH48902.1 hypothetical protein [Candidatus Woesearchaeota archaeon]HIJ04345.1 hypothetical protein [Candidatus Woesearchaeota archaeon]